MARDAADSANEYSDNLNSLEPALHNALVDITGLITGPVGAGIIDGQLTYYETGNVKTAVVHGGTTAAVGIVFGRAGGIVGRPLGRMIASRLSARAATAVAGAESREATGAFHSLSDPIADVLGPAHTSHPEELAAVINHVESAGGRVSFRAGEFAYGPGSKGQPGQVILDPDASIGAVRHEYQHFLDDEAAGRPDLIHYLRDESLIERWRFEIRGCQIELRLAKQLQSGAARRQLIENAQSEKRTIFGR